MNRFLGRKKTRDGESPTSEINAENTSPEVRPTSSKDQTKDATKKKGWRKKRPDVEPEAEVITPLALPTVESFRTSLIMNNLSHRFSMLRDQDDPHSLMGKASDDSVLAPKRRSRLGDFGYTGSGLYEIAETASLSSQIRPPFGLQRNGSYSYGDGYGTDDDSSAAGSIMTRARPGEGNMLFGGRQKIYRIPIGDAGSVNSLGGSDSRGMRGRALYEDDVGISTFQKLRTQEKARQREEQLVQDSRDVSIDEMRKDSLNFPSYRYDERRETVSSTNSGPSMLSQSTAATSVAPSLSASSPGLPTNQALAVERSRSRKLYEQGLDQHMQEQQAAAVGRIASIKRTSMNANNNAPYRSASAGNLRDRIDKSPRSVSPLLAPQKPSPTDSLQPSIESTPATSRPLSPEVIPNEGEKALFHALEPHDRGMATATGRFNRPKQFNEEQFMKRQMSLLQQQKLRVNKGSPSATNAPASPTGGSPTSTKPPSSFTSRPRTSTNRTDRSWSNSSRATEATVFNDSNIERLLARETGKSQPQLRSTPSQNQTFFSPDPDDESDYEQSDDGPLAEHPSAGGAPEIPQMSPDRELKHPALRTAISSCSETDNKVKRQAWSPERLQSGLDAAVGRDLDYFTVKDRPVPESSADSNDPSSDTNGDIKGLVREHLRHPSNASSIYPPARTPRPDHAEFDLRVPSMYVPQNPWDDEEAPPLPSKPLESHYPSDLRQVPSSDPFYGSPDISQGNDHWQEELNKTHARGDSTETAYENRAFKSELTQRSKIIAENMRVKSPPELQRNQSPMNAQSKNVFESSRRPFGMLKPKTSREHMSTQRTDQPRPSFSSNNNERPSVKQRGRGNHAAPAPIGRTLHSKMPRQSEDGSRGPPPGEYSSQAGRPSTDQERSRPSRGQTRPMHGRTSPPEHYNVRNAQRDRIDAQLQGIDDRDRERSDGRPRPSLDINAIRRDSGNGRSPVPLSAPAAENPAQRPNFTTSNSSSARMSPIESRRPLPFSAHSTPPLSSVSTPNLMHSSSATTVSMISQSSVGTQEHPGSNPTPSTGFFFPSPMATSATTPTESSAVPTTKKATLKPRPRKPTINKQDISEPMLIASTSAVGTVDLPEGASLQNGLRDDFDVVLMNQNKGHDLSAPAPPPSIPYSPNEAQGRKKSFFRFGKKGKETETDVFSVTDEPEPTRFRIQRLENETGKVGHKALRAGPGEEDAVSPGSSLT